MNTAFPSSRVSVTVFLFLAFCVYARAEAVVSKPHSEDVVIVVDKKVNKLYLAKNKATGLEVFKTFDATLGQVIGDKNIEGDRKTPEGIYQFQFRSLPSNGLKPKFGSMALYVSYPNVLDRKGRKTGFDILIHGTNDPSRLEKKYDSLGCVIVLNEQIEELWPYVRLKETKLIITRDFEAQRNPSRRAKAQKFLDEWLTAWSSKDIDKYVDRANIFGNMNKVPANTDTSHSSYASLGLKEGAAIIGSSNSVTGGGTIVIGASNTVWGATSFGYMNMALGNTIKIGHTTKHARDSYAFGKNLTMDGRISSSNIKDVRNIMMVGFDFSANNAIHDENTRMILFGAGGSRPSIAMYPDPDDQSKANNLIMGSNHVAYHSGTAYPLQGGIGSGCFILHGSNTKAPSVDIPEAVTMYAGDRSYDGNNAVVGGKGLIVKGENSGRTYISERVGINVSHNSAKDAQINEDVEAGLHIFGEGNSDATSSVKVENSDGNVAIEVLNDLVVVMPNLPTSSAGLPTGALYNDGGTVKVA